jgi:hypothetical protein
MTASGLFAALALLPAMTGPIGGAEQASLQVLLCGGGAMSTPLEGSPAPRDGTAPCCAKGCHSSSSRRRLDHAQ